LSKTEAKLKRIVAIWTSKCR